MDRSETGRAGANCAYLYSLYLYQRCFTPLSVVYGERDALSQHHRLRSTSLFFPFAIAVQNMRPPQRRRRRPKPPSSSSTPSASQNDHTAAYVIPLTLPKYAITAARAALRQDKFSSSAMRQPRNDADSPADGDGDGDVSIDRCIYTRYAYSYFISSIVYHHFHPAPISPLTIRSFSISISDSIAASCINNAPPSPSKSCATAYTTPLTFISGRIAKGEIPTYGKRREARHYPRNLRISPPTFARRAQRDRSASKGSKR